MKSNTLTTKIAILSISMFFLGGVAVLGTMPHLRDHFGLTQMQVELLMSGIAISKIAAIFISEPIAKRVGLKNTCTLGLFLIGLAGFLPLISHNYTFILASRLTYGAALGLFNGLAIRFITLIYSGKTRSVMLGLRGAVESAGIIVLTLLAGLLMNISWHLSFTIYLLAWPVAIFFHLNVSKVEEVEEPGHHHREKIPPIVFGLAFFAVLVVINIASIAMRFPAIGTEIHGSGFNASHWIALKPFAAILAGMSFGKLKFKIGRNVFHLGLLAIVIANILVAFSGDRFYLLVLGSAMSQVCAAWTFPFIVEQLADITTSSNHKLAMLIFLLGTNVGNFASTLTMGAIHFILRNDNLTAPFYIYGILFGILLMGIMLQHHYLNKKKPSLG